MYLHTLGQIFLSRLMAKKIRLRVGGTKKKKKSSENDQLTGDFQSFFFFLITFFSIAVYIHIPDKKRNAPLRFSH